MVLKTSYWRRSKPLDALLSHQVRWWKVACGERKVERRREVWKSEGCVCARGEPF